MRRLHKILSSPILSILLIFICVVGFIRYNYVSNELKREQGEQVYSHLHDNLRLTRYIESKLEMHGAEGINDDVLMHVNHLIFVGGRPVLMYDHLFSNVYQRLLRELSSATSIDEEERLMAAVLGFHEDIREIVAFADENCQIVTKWGVSADYINYAQLIDPKSKLYEEFNELIQEKIEASSNRLE